VIIGVASSSLRIQYFMIDQNTLISDVTLLKLCPTRGSTVEVHSYKRIGGRHPLQGSRKNKVCLFQGEDGDGEESISVAEMDKYWEL